MGHQQLLLILVGTIAVILAVVVGITLFQKSAVEVNRDQIVSDLVYLSTDAQAYFKKQTESGGGDGSFEGWSIPDSYAKHENNDKYIKVKVKKNKVTINGYGTEIGINGKATVRAKAVVTSTNTSITIMN